MAQSALNDVLRHLRRLCEAESDRDLDDGTLLERFFKLRDETAFAILVQRHGPMVLAVCRRVLRDAESAEDAFQATFLVLVRRCAADRERASLASWLYGVARRVALQARARDAARRRRERRCTQTAPAPYLDELTWQELRSVLDEELGLLPERYKAPIVLCHLEGKSYEQAARELGWPKTSLASRLNRAREVLRGRLARRGVAVTAAVLAAGLSERAASAALPALLTLNVVKAASLVAAGKTTAAAALAAKAIVLADVSMKKIIGLKAAVLAVLFAGSIVAGGVGLKGYLAAGQAAPAAQPGAPAKDSDGRRPAQEKPASPSRETLTYSGQVLNPDGNPVAGAKLFLEDWSKAQGEPLVRATTAADGRFQFQVTKPAVLEHPLLWPSPGLVAVAPGYGPDWAMLRDMRREKPTTGITLRLVAPGPPIQGRVLSLEGRPLAGVTVRPARIEATPDENLAAVFRAWKSSPYQASGLLQNKALRQPWLAGIPKSVSTGTDGSFSLPNVGRERIMVLEIEGPNIERKIIRVVPRTAEEIKGLKEEVAPRNAPRMFYDASPTLYPSTFQHLARPTRIIAGTIREQRTGKPLAGVKVNGNATGSWWEDYVQGVTDAKGQFHLAGLPQAKSYQLSTYAGEPQTHLPAFKLVRSPDGLNPIQVDFELMKGITITGRLLDKGTGKPIPLGHVTYVPLNGNKFLSKSPGADSFGFAGQSFMTDVEGKYSLKALPGLGMISAQVRTARDDFPYSQAKLSADDRKQPFYYRMAGNDAIRTADGAIQTLTDKNAYRIIDPAPDVESVTCDLELDRGKSIVGTVRDQNGNSLAGAVVLGLQALFSKPQKLDSASFTASAIDPANPRRLLFAHEQKKLAGTLILRGNENRALEVKLEPWGSVTGQVVNEDGKPLANATITLTYKMNDPALHPVRWMKPGETPDVTTDNEGRFKVDGLVPGMTCVLANARSRDGFLDVTNVPQWVIRPGETKDLGAIVAKPFEPK